MSSRAPRNEKNRGKNNKLIIAAKTNRKATYCTYEYTKCILFRFETQRFSKGTHLRIVKLQEFKTEADELSVCLLVCYYYFKINGRKQTQMLHTYKKHDR